MSNVMTDNSIIDPKLLTRTDLNSDEKIVRMQYGILREIQYFDEFNYQEAVNHRFSEKKMVQYKIRKPRPLTPQLLAQTLSMDEPMVRAACEKLKQMGLIAGCDNE